MAALAGWTARAGGDAGPELALLGAVAGAYVLGRVVGATRSGRTGGLLAVAAGVVIAVLSAPDGLSGGPLAGPVGYGNANGAICTLGVGAVLAAGFSWRPLVARLTAVVAAGGLTWLALQTGSSAATSLSAALVALAVVLTAAGSLARFVPAATVLALLAAIGVTVALGVSPRETVLSDRRAVLWSEAVDLVREAPVDGVGVGGFATQAPTAIADPDARWAHSVWLEQAAETGLPGGMLLLGLGLTAVLAVQLRRGATGVGAARALGTAALGAVLVHASIDYVLSFPIVSVLAATVLGLNVIAERDPPHLDLRHSGRQPGLAV